MKITSLISLLLLILLASCNLNNQPNINEIPSPSIDNSMYPRLFTDNTGTVFMSWMERKGDLTSLKYSSFNEGKWDAPIEISSDSGWFINWADFPSIIAQNGQPVAAHWLNKMEGGTYAYAINMSVFDNTWSSAFKPHEDNTATEHGFVSMVPASDSTFMAVWLDGRETAHRADDEYGDLQKAMTLRGALISHSGQVLETYLLDESVCDCCNTSITKTDSGFIVAYRNRTEDEVRDIYTVTIKDGIVTKPKPVHSDHWEIAACPVNGPAISYHQNTIALSWFTADEGKAKVKLALSANGGNQFSSPIILDEENPTGRVDLEMNEETIWVSWLTSENEKDLLKVASYSIQGEKKREYEIGGISKDRNAGFPQITAYKDGLMIATTHIENDQSRIVTKYLAD
ncbi:MAG: hypothetical protein CL666_07795 [Balneola sp.]|nr:hypothetical protein [Balneola sp.]|tara:strand:- start:29819 stop:31018 length:1200 start_codon:yes stop_codon:yes gene_type:complete